MEESKILKILVDSAYVSQEDAQKAFEFFQKNKTPIDEYLLSHKLITKDILGQAMAEFYEIPYADLNSHPAPKESVLKIPEAIAKKHRLVLFSENEKDVVLTTDNPEQKNFPSELGRIFSGKEIKLAYSVMEDIDNSFIHYRRSLEIRFKKIKKDVSFAPEMIDEIFEDAIMYRASDIHFEPQEKEIIIRFRIDGILQEAGRVSKEYYENILNRVKVQSRLRIDEHFCAQDGAIRYQRRNGHMVDMRVSLVPTLDGEKIVIRLLSEYVKGFTMSDLGLSEKDQEILLKASKKPFGMILVTGPTGSGKTTTLYALLKILSCPEVNVTTIEDPVEFKIGEINQIQVNPQTNLTFSEGLRSIVRQDPDIILVGEIRDKETAEIAVNAALTGHILLSTFHANDASSTVPRLLDMGIEHFLLASTMNLIIAQRLVRRICENCRTSEEVEIENLEKIFPSAKEYFKDKKTTLYRGKGCEACNGTGFKGRTAIFEFIGITREIQDLIVKNPSAKEIWDLARKQGARSLFDDGIEKVKSGATTLEELLRVANPT
ncbi:MAG: Type II secretion system protein E [uncultured bacterium]|nr:MAG: Type II secretion system protein E [uncultured bacterium]HBR71414.1 hypothetical protein [Candidatus Moranbacteria bacterium]